MITCDRCEIKIELPIPKTSYELGFVACVACRDVFEAGLDKINEDIRQITAERLKNWREEWQRNYKKE